MKMKHTPIPQVGIAADFSSGFGTGIARYQRGVQIGLADVLAQQPTDSSPLKIFRPFNRSERALGLPEPLEFTRLPLPGKVQRFLNLNLRIPIERLLPKLKDVEVIHSLLPERLHTSLPWVITVYDVAWRYFNQDYQKVFSAQLRAEAEAAIATADWIITISQSSADDLVTGGVDAKRIVVAAPGVDAKFYDITPEQVTALQQKYKLPEKFVAYVGTFFPRKNVGTLIQAIKESRSTEAPPLILAGPPPVEGLAYWGIDGRHIRHIGFLDEAELPSFYAAAHLLAFPSVFEGFGLPLVEAMATQTPVVASNLKVFREVGNDAYLAFDPHSSEAVKLLRDAIDQLWNDDQLREDLIKAGQKRATLFTWQACCEAILETYAQAIK